VGGRKNKMVECNFKVQKEVGIFKKRKIENICLLKLQEWGYNFECDEEKCIFQKILKK